MESYRPILELTCKQMQGVREGSSREHLQASRLYQRLSVKHKKAYVESLKDSIDNDMLEWYYRVRLIFDYISGMTDDYAMQEYRILRAL